MQAFSSWEFAGKDTLSPNNYFVLASTQMTDSDWPVNVLNSSLFSFCTHYIHFVLR